MTIDRRDFLKQTSRGALAAAAITATQLDSTTAQADDEDNPLPIIDAHQHLWDLTKFKPPWLAGHLQNLHRYCLRLETAGCQHRG